MIVLENSVIGKTHCDNECEDGLVITDDFVAVIDGATDKTGLRYEGMTGGRYAMLACIDAVETAAADIDAKGMVERMSGILAERLPSDITLEERPDAAVSIYSVLRREVWQVGDVGYWHEGVEHTGIRTGKAVDHFFAGTRAAVLTTELIRGVSADELIKNDIGRETIREALTKQGLFRNNSEAGEWAYGAINGMHVPHEFIEIHPIADEIDELVLASDGYPLIFPTFLETEQTLKELLTQDPLCIGPLRGTKGVKPGNSSFDDRSYVRICLN